MTPAPTATAAAAPASAPAPLAPEDLQTQLAAIEVLTAMWAGDDELELSSTYHHQTTASASTADARLSAQMASLDLQQHAGSTSASSAREGGGGEEDGDGEGRGDRGRGVEALVEYLALPLEMLGGDESRRVKAALPASIVLGLSIDPLAGSEERREGDAHAPGEHQQQHEEGEGERRRRKALARKLMLDVSFSLRRSAPALSSSTSSTSTSTAPSRRSETWPQVRLRRQLDWLPATLARSAAQESLRRAAGLRRKDGRFEALPLGALPDSGSDADPDAHLGLGGGEEEKNAHAGDGEEEEEEEADIASTVLDLVERISEAAARVLPPLLAAAASSSSSSTNTNNSQSTSGAAQQQQQESQRTTREVYRSWSCLPSLSTREKRAELVAYARAHEPPLTGFVLAGKPALVVLEYPLADRPEGGGGGKERGKEEAEEEEEEARRSLLAYWSEIKTRSWADIQASHKKVSETLVERRVARCFYPSPSPSSSSSSSSPSSASAIPTPTPTLTLELGMEDVTGTEQVGGREALRGTYKHRNDWRLVERWLEALRCGGRLKSALGADW